MVVAAELAAKHQHTLGQAYLRIERSMPETFRYLEIKRVAAGLDSVVAAGDVEMRAEPWEAPLRYSGNIHALEAMLSCTVRPLSRRSR